MRNSYLNLILINVLILVSAYGLYLQKFPHNNVLIILLLVVSIFYNLFSYSYLYNPTQEFLEFDFSQQTKSSLDIFNWRQGITRNHLPDKCGHCDGTCSLGPVGHNYPPESFPLCPQLPLAKTGSGDYRLQVTGYPKKYLAYIVNPFKLYLGEPQTPDESLKPELIWTFKKQVGVDTYTIQTCRQPTLYLEGHSKGKLSVSYFPGGQTQAWKLFQAKDGMVFIKTNNQEYYLNTDGENVFLGSDMLPWRLVNSTCISTLENFQNEFDFPDTPDKPDAMIFKDGTKYDLGEWNKYYTLFWNGEYTYYKTTSKNNDYLTVSLTDTDGSGTIHTTDGVWKVKSYGSNLLWGENQESYIYLEMLDKVQMKDSNRPQIRIVVKDKSTGKLQTLVDKNRNNLQAYTYKVGKIGERVTGYREKFSNPPSGILSQFGLKGISLLGSGYNMPTVNLNVKKPCVIQDPKLSPKDLKTWSGIDRTGKMKDNSLYQQPIQIYYTWVYQCPNGELEESRPSPAYGVNRTFSKEKNLYGPKVMIYGNSNDNSLKNIRVYIKGGKDNDYVLRDEYKNQKEISYTVMPRV